MIRLLDENDKQELVSKIEGIETGDVDLSDYYNKAEVNGIKQELNNKIKDNEESINALNERIDGVESGGADLTNYYTKLEVDNKIGANSTSIEGLSGDIESLEGEVSSLTASVNYMSEHKADTTTVNGVISDVSQLEGRMTENENVASGNTSTINALKASVTNLQNADTELSKNIASASQIANTANGKVDSLTERVDNLETGDVDLTNYYNKEKIDEMINKIENEKLSEDSKNYVAIEQTIGSGIDLNNFKPDAQADPVKKIYYNINETNSVIDNSPVTADMGPYMLIVEHIPYEQSGQDAHCVKQTYISLHGAGSQAENFIEYQRFYHRIGSYWTSWEKTGHTAIEDLYSKITTLTTGQQNLENSKLNKNGQNYIPIEYITGSKDFNNISEDFVISETTPCKKIYYNSDPEITSNAPFSTNKRYPYILTIERIQQPGHQSNFCKILQKCVYLENPMSASAVFYEYQRTYYLAENVWTSWEKTGHTAIKDLYSKVEALEEAGSIDISNYYNKTEINTKFNEANTDTNSRFSTVEAQINGTLSAVTELQSDVDSLSSSVNYMSEHKADTATVNGIASDVSKLEESVAQNETDITALQLNKQETDLKLNNAITNLGNLEASVSENETNITALQLNKQETDLKVNNLITNFGGLEADVSSIDERVDTEAGKIGVLQGTLGFEAKNKYKNTTASTTKSGVTFTVNDDGTITVNGTATATISFQLSPNLNIQSNNLAGNIFSFGALEEVNKNYRGLVQYFDSNWTKKTETYLNSTETTLLNYTYGIAFIYIIKGTTLNNVVFKPMLRDGNIEDDTYSPYGGLNVIKRFERFSTQKVLYTKASGTSSSPLTVKITNLFVNYSSVICNVTTSSDKYSLVLPLQYIKSLGTSTNYEAEDLLFTYVDDSNLQVRTGLGSSNPTISNLSIISLY